MPAVASKYLVVDPVSYSAMRQIPRFSEYYSAGDAGLRALVDGAVGKIKDFFVFRSQLVQKTGSGPVNTHNLAFARDAIGLVIRRLPQPLPGTGAIAEYAEMGNFGIRVVMSYQPNTLGAAIHRGRAVRDSGSSKLVRSAGEQLGGRELRSQRGRTRGRRLSASQKGSRMDLRVFFQKLRKIEQEISGPARSGGEPRDARRRQAWTISGGFA